MNGLNLSWGTCSDRGLRRAANEDSFLASPPVFLVADGMGGHEAGSEASRRALDGFGDLVGTPHATPEQVELAFHAAVTLVNEIPHSRSAAGTTLSGVVVSLHAEDAYWLVLNIGDSRTYRFAEQHLEQVSTDHSAVQALVELGQISPADAALHPERNVVTRAVGGGSTENPDYWLLPIDSGDRMLICSDGLTKELDDARIAEILAQEPAAQRAATRLVHEALLNGGHDNVTVVIVDAYGDPAADDEPTRPSDAAAGHPNAALRNDDTREVPTATWEDPHHAEL